jgi:hypothetical protein
MILIMTSSELTRYAFEEWVVEITLEQENEEPTDSESKTEVAESDEVIFTVFSAVHYNLSSKQGSILCFPPQTPSYGVCKIHLEPPDNRLNA